jgi:hypothetical protein
MLPGRPGSSGSAGDGVQAVLDDPQTARRQLASPYIGRLPLATAIDQFYTAKRGVHPRRSASAWLALCPAAITRIRKHAESMNAAPRVGQAQSQLSSLPWHEYWNTD